MINILVTTRKLCFKISTSKNGIAKLVNKTDFDDKPKNLNKKLTSNKTKY